jgi:hypothetical protein
MGEVTSLDFISSKGLYGLSSEKKNTVRRLVWGCTMVRADLPMGQVGRACLPLMSSASSKRVIAEPAVNSL